MSFIQYLRDELGKIKMLSFTSEYSEEAKSSFNDKETLLSSEEHSKLSQEDLGNVLVDSESTIRWYFSYLSNHAKMTSLGLLVKMLYERLKNENALQGGNCLKTGEFTATGGIASFGAGPCVLEYFLASMIPDMKVYACDYDSFMVDNAQRQFHNITTSRFDFYKDDVSSYIRENDIRFVVMFGSSCSMDDDKYTEFLSELHNSQVECVITFEAGMSSRSEMMKLRLITLCYCVKHYFLVRDNKQLRTGCLHAYTRTKSEFMRIYKKSGWKFHELDRSLQAYPLISLLTR